MVTLGLVLAAALGLTAAVALSWGERWAWRRACERLNGERVAFGLHPVYPAYPGLPQTGVFTNEWRS